MAHIKIEGWTTPPDIAKARNLIGQIIHVFVDSELRGISIPFFEYFRCARVRSVRERADTDRICPNCNEHSQIAFDVIWESGFEGHTNEVCEQCLDGRIIEGGEALTFGDQVQP